MTEIDNTQELGEPIFVEISASVKGGGGIKA